MKTTFAAISALALLATAAEAKVYRHTYYAPDQNRTVSLANPTPLPLTLKENQLSTSFKLTAKTRVMITVSATCAIASPGVGLVPHTNLRFYLKVEIDGQPLPNTAGHAFCTGDATDTVDNFDTASLTIAKTLNAGLHTLQLIPNPQPLLGTGNSYHIHGLSVVVAD